MRTSVYAAAATLLLALTLGGCASSPATTPSETAGSSAPSDDATCAYSAGDPSAKDGVTRPPTDPDVSGEIAATISTSVGDISLTLNADAAPCTVNSFVSLAEQGYFDNTVCHRLTTSGIFVLQCGDPSATGRGGPGYSFADELTGSEKYEAGTLAMANAGPNTNGSQFFLVYKSAPGALAPAYTDFGTFDAASVEIVEKVAAAGNASDGTAPATEVAISGVTVTR